VTNRPEEEEEELYDQIRIHSNDHYVGAEMQVRLSSSISVMSSHSIGYGCVVVPTTGA